MSNFHHCLRKKKKQKNMGVLRLHRAVFLLEISLLLSSLVLCDLTPLKSLDLSPIPSDSLWYCFLCLPGAYQMERQKVYPQGMEKILIYLMESYPNIPMIITENGNGTIDNPNSTIEKIVQDLKRVKYMTEYFDAMLRAMRNGADVRGYFVWSLLDNFEWLSGHKGRFGLHHVDYATLNRTRKSSATRYKRFIARHKEKVLQLLPKQNGNNFQY